jgi:hypothetical protein
VTRLIKGQRRWRWPPSVRTLRRAGGYENYWLNPCVGNFRARFLWLKPRKHNKTYTHTLLEKAVTMLQAPLRREPLKGQDRGGLWIDRRSSNHRRDAILGKEHCDGCADVRARLFIIEWLGRGSYQSQQMKGRDDSAEEQLCRSFRVTASELPACVGGCPGHEKDLSGYIRNLRRLHLMA